MQARDPLQNHGPQGSGQNGCASHPVLNSKAQADVIQRVLSGSFERCFVVPLASSRGLITSLPELIRCGRMDALLPWHECGLRLRRNFSPRVNFDRVLLPEKGL